MTTRTNLEIEGMHCDHCQVAVGAALDRAGLDDVRVDWRRGEASGVPRATFSAERAGEEIAGIGYAVTSVDVPREDPSPVASDANAEHDLLIIGSGSAAFGAAIKARDLGARVAMIERDTIGGTCVNIGCVPSKALLRAAESYWKAGHNPFAGVPTSTGQVDLAALLEQKRGLVDQLRADKYRDLVDLYDIDFIQGDARFIDAETVAVGDLRLRAGRVLIASGAEPWVPPIPGLDEVEYLTSTTALELESVPSELIIVGANAIGLEMGQLFTHLGSRVTFVEALDRIAPFEEPEISSALAEYLVSQGAAIHTGAVATGVGRTDDRVWLEVAIGESKGRLTADRILMATGRRARSGDLDLAVAGVAVDRRGHVVVDDNLVTSNPRVFAAGDVTTHPQFVYVAALGGAIAAENALRGTGREIEFELMPRVTFTSPTIASVGMTEADARAAGRAVITSVLPLELVPRALVDHATDGLVKLVADESTGHLLGAHVLAEGAGEVIQAAVMALKYRATIEEIANTFHPYLTMAEALKLAAQGFGKDVKTLSCCAA